MNAAQFTRGVRREIAAAAPGGRADYWGPASRRFTLFEEALR